MATKEYDMDIRVVDALRAEITNERLPLQVQTGIPFTSECGNQMMHVQIDCADNYADKLGFMLSKVINRTYGLN